MTAIALSYDDIWGAGDNIEVLGHPVTAQRHQTFQSAGTILVSVLAPDLSHEVLPRIPLVPGRSIVLDCSGVPVDEDGNPGPGGFAYTVVDTEDVSEENQNELEAIVAADNAGEITSETAGNEGVDGDPDPGGSPATDDGETQSYPIPTGSGWYELSDGERVRGEEEAVAAQDAIDAAPADQEEQ